MGFINYCFKVLFSSEFNYSEKWPYPNSLLLQMVIVPKVFIPILFFFFLFFLGGGNDLFDKNPFREMIVRNQNHIFLQVFCFWRNDLQDKPNQNKTIPNQKHNKHKHIKNQSAINQSIKDQLPFGIKNPSDKWFFWISTCTHLESTNDFHSGISLKHFS